jgi:gamma-glutamyltranspeptidase / glutathione hydrolase
MISTIQKHNGTMTLDDLAEYRAIERRAINITYRDYTIFSSGVPSSGAVGLSTLKTVEGYDIQDNSDVNLTWHRFDEALRFACKSPSPFPHSRAHCAR